MVFSSIFLNRLTRVSRYRWDGRQTRHSDDVDAEDEYQYFSDPSSTGAVENGSLAEYGTFDDSGRNHDYDDSPQGTPWAFKRNWWVRPASTAHMHSERPERSHEGVSRRGMVSYPNQETSTPAARPTSPLPISGLQSELSDADDEIDVFKQDLFDSAATHEQSHDAIPTTLAEPNRGRQLRRGLITIDV